MDSSSSSKVRKFAVPQLRWATANYELCRKVKAKLDAVNIKACRPTQSWENEWDLTKPLLVWLMQETAERAKRYLPRSLQNARLRRVERAKQRQVPGSDPRVSYKLMLSPEQIKALKSSSHQKGIDVGGDSGQLEQLELAPVDVYDRFQRYLLSLHPDTYAPLPTSLRWVPLS